MNCKQDPKPHNAKMFWAASYLCFFGFLQSGEIVSPSQNKFDPLSHLCFCNVKVDSHSSPSCLQITIEDRHLLPRSHFVYWRLCPVFEVLNYMVACGSSPGPLLTWENGHYLTRESFVARVRLALSAAGYTAKNYAGHSFRIGAGALLMIILKALRKLSLDSAFSPAMPQKNFTAQCGIQYSKPLAGGRVQRTPVTLRQYWKSFAKSQKPCCQIWSSNPRTNDMDVVVVCY